MRHTLYISCLVCAMLLTAGRPARAQSAEQQQVDAIFNAWSAMDTAQNRAMVKQQGRALEAKLFAPVEKPGWHSPIYSKLPSIPHLAYTNARGLASLAITDQGLATRTYTGGRTKNYFWGDKPSTIKVVKRTSNIGTTKLRPLHWPLPNTVARAFPKLARKLGAWRAKRLIRKAVRAGKAPQPARVARALSPKRGS